jgi:5'-3' exonuclease
MQNRYYKEKLEVDPSRPGEVRKAVEAYIAGLHWVLEYYYR